MDIGWQDWVGFVLALAGVLSYIRTWRTERIRTQCVESVHLETAKRALPIKVEDVVERAAALEMYIRRGKPKPTVPEEAP